MPVLETYAREVSETCTVTIEGESIETTANHPFYTVDEGWVSAGNLEAGDRVELSDGSSGEIDSVKRNELEDPITVYNFCVMDYDTYYVGESEVFVHNCKASSMADDALKAATKADEVAEAAIKGGSKTIDDIIDNLSETTNGKGVARNFESTGGFDQTIKDFDSLNPIDVKEIQTQYGPGKVGKLSDGTTIVARPGSATGGATLEIRVSNSKVYKIRY